MIKRGKSHPGSFKMAHKFCARQSLKSIAAYSAAPRTNLELHIKFVCWVEEDWKSSVKFSGGSTILASDVESHSYRVTSLLS
jgi:hypothetical protein